VPANCNSCCSSRLFSVCLASAARESSSTASTAVPSRFQRRQYQNQCPRLTSVELCAGACHDLLSMGFRESSCCIMFVLMKIRIEWWLRLHTNCCISPGLGWGPHGKRFCSTGKVQSARCLHKHCKVACCRHQSGCDCQERIYTDPGHQVLCAHAPWRRLLFEAADSARRCIRSVLHSNAASTSETHAWLGEASTNVTNKPAARPSRQGQ
jgi:hypothetical protein